MRNTLISALLASVAMTSVGRAAEAPKWQPHIDLEGKIGSDRNLGEADFFLPLAQNADSLLFANLRTRMDGDGGFEGNAGLGVRRMLDGGWNLGAYGYFDRRRSDNGNYFNQVTLGGELLGSDWDFRVNGYVPVGTRKRTVAGLSAADFTGGGIFVRLGQEQSMGGADAEVGFRLPVFDEESGKALRLYGGGYHFTGDGAAPNITGPRGRLELTFDQTPYLWEGSRLTLGGELQHDDPRGTQGFLSARLRIPLQIFGGAAPSSMTAQERRMADPVVRDVDVVTQAGAFGPREAAGLANGNPLVVLDASGMSGADMQTALTAAGANSTVVLKGDFDTSVPTTLQAGQTVMGKGDLAVKTASGYQLSVQTPGASITMTPPGFGAGTRAIIVMANDSALIGMTLNSSDSAGAGVNYRGINAIGVSNVLIANNILRQDLSVSPTSSSSGIGVENSTNVIIRGNDVRTTNSNSNAAGLVVLDSSVQVKDNIFSGQGSDAAHSFGILLADTTGTSLTILSGSTGNRILSGSCDIPIAMPVGTIGLVGGGTCP